MRDDAVSSVVSAVLVFGLFVTVASVYTMQSLPDRIADREANHHREVTGSMAALRPGLEALSARGDPGPVSATVDLGAPPVAMLQQVPATASLGLQGEAVFTASFEGERLYGVDGTGAATPDDDIGPSGDTLEDVLGLQSLVLGLAGKAVGADDHAVVTVVASDGTRTVTARLVFAADAYLPELGCTGRDIRLQVVTEALTTHRLLACGIDQELPMYQLELLDDAHPFKSAVARLEAPFDVQLSDAAVGNAVVTGTFSAIWTSADGMETSGSGLAQEFSVVQAGPALVYDPSYREYVDEDTAWVGGALVHVQGARQAVAVDPAFRMTVEGGVGRIQWTLVELDGEGARSGAGQAMVEVTHTSSQLAQLSASGATFTVTGDHAVAWRGFFEDAVLSAGAQGAAVAGGSGDTATLTLTSGVVSEWRFELRLVEATVKVR